MNITVTEGAEIYLADLLSKQDVEGIAVRVFVTQPGTPYAETCLAYCRPEEVVEDDECNDLSKIRVYVERNSLPYLEEATIDFSEDRMGGQLTIKAPNAKMPKVSADSPLADQINYILYSEINPGLASHGGEVSLIEVIEEEQGSIAVLRFGGGCQGCSAVDMTLKDGVEKTLVERIDSLVAVRDVTDHSQTENAYYK
ncbi:Fe-S biogenesis protein NfuA [Marinobacterium jannaschii]|uniref:Fe-S biogenesis protein NfuA n=1 Tax=Marinobacterium jannaschii TaxID=64970 RepID=UPI00047F51F2|nr:Fe-S biogenesis protein NfuA [Marinobacterium jannaschii]